jgi:hypothetical protein
MVVFVCYGYGNHKVYKKTAFSGVKIHLGGICNPIIKTRWAFSSSVGNILP